MGGWHLRCQRVTGMWMSGARYDFLKDLVSAVEGLVGGYPGFEIMSGAD